MAPVERHARCDRETVLGTADGRAQQLVEAARAVAVEQQLPAGDRTRHRDGVRAIRADGGDAAAHQPLDGEAGGRAARAVHRDHAARRRGVEHEAVAADAGHVRLDHALHGNGGDSRVNRIAAGPEHVEGGQRRLGMRGGGHAVLAVGRGTARKLEIAHEASHPGRERRHPSARVRPRASGPSPADRAPGPAPPRDRGRRLPRRLGRG